MEKKKLGECLNYWQVREVKETLVKRQWDDYISASKNTPAVSLGPDSYSTIMPHSQMLWNWKCWKIITCQPRSRWVKVSQWAQVLFWYPYAPGGSCWVERILLLFLRPRQLLLAEYWPLMLFRADRMLLLFPCFAFSFQSGSSSKAGHSVCYKAPLEQKKKDRHRWQEQLFGILIKEQQSKQHQQTQHQICLETSRRIS